MLNWDFTLEYGFEVTGDIKIVMFSDVLSPSRALLKQWCDELAPADVKRAQGMKSEQRLRQFVLGRKLLQQALAEFYNLPLSLQLHKSGKPEAVGAAVSLSHSGGKVAVALTEPRNTLGVDIEVYKNRSFMRLARHYFAPEEVSELELLSELEQRHCFFKFWVLKESLAKFTGSGLSSKLLRSAFVAQQNSAGPVSFFTHGADWALSLTVKNAAQISYYEAVFGGDVLTLQPQAREFQSWQPPLI